GEMSETTGSLTITGGWIAVYAVGDGIDVNGNSVMTGGTALVHGPTNGGNGALDYDGTFNISGGVLIAAGSKGMLQSPSTSSTQYTITTSFSSAKSANTLFGIKDASGNTIVAFKPSKQYESVIVCAPGITRGTSYTAYTGGSVTGSETDGYYVGGSYTAGTSVGSATVSSAVTTIGSGGGGFNPRPGW
ncbi:MAG: dockerin type 1, partial [Clostridia bacterium]|nr:dockerin type 1 [Clostridia bacterium]